MTPTKSNATLNNHPGAVFVTNHSLVIRSPGFFIILEGIGRKGRARICSDKAWLDGLGPIVDITVDGNQNITQFQNIEVNGINNLGVIGAGIEPFRLVINPSQWAKASAFL